MKHFFKIVGKGFAALAVVFLLLVGSIELYKASQGNFHSVTEGELYRSSQLDRDNFEYYIKEKGIKTIINLRGAGKGHTWYDDELQVSNDLNVTHYDFRMSAYSAIDINRSQEIINLMAKAEKPILIHCHGGADRSALISALWLYGVKKTSSTAAQEQFKLLYGYFPYLMWDKKKAMRESFLAYKDYVEQSH